jgi:uroporphyrinogen III methyltransferase/synthase
MNRVAGQRILLTRSADDCAEWAQRLASLGATPVELPCIDAERIDTPELRAGLAAAVPQADWLVFTSRRGVEAFAGLYAGPLGKARVATVGPATAEAARTRLGRHDLAGELGTAESLAATMLASGTLEGRPQLLLAVAENADDRLQNALQSAALCTRFDVYRTIPSPPRASKRPLSSLGADNVVLASPSAVTGFMNQVDTDAHINVFTIGPSTSAAARRAGLAVTAEAREPSFNGILEAMQWRS